MTQDIIFWIKDLFGGRWRSDPRSRRTQVAKARREFWEWLYPFMVITFGILLAKVVGL